MKTERKKNSQQSCIEWPQLAAAYAPLFGNWTQHNASNIWFVIL